MINRQQKAIIHEYSRAARLGDATYRRILRSSSGCASCADRSFTQAGFDAVMAALETVLFQRVEAGEVPDPVGLSRYVHEEFYWRRKLPRAGFITSRQAHRLRSLWSQLQEHLHPSQRSAEYLAGIIAKATGLRDVGFMSLSSRDAACLIDALEDRLSYAIRSAPVAPVSDAFAVVSQAIAALPEVAEAEQEEPVPF